MSDQSTPQQDKKTEGQRFLHAQTGYQLLLSLSQDEMECRAHLELKPSGQPPGLEELQGFLAGDGITVGLSEAALLQLLAESQAHKSANALVASGVAPLKGDDGRLEYSFVALERPATVAPADEQTEEKRQVDFKVVQQFINVEPDQEIGRILPPTGGTPGSTVRGKAVAAEAGKPLYLKTGQHVRTGGDDGSILIAEIHGRVKLDGDTISVVEEYVVEGDVDFSVGNIRFNGFVEVRGDVLDGFQVSASKGIKITGNVGSCRLISHGNIEFCGMDGQGKGSILCGGNLNAHFIHDSAVECWGNMLIDVELRNCTVHCRGSLVSGLLSGGDYISLAGVEVKRLGAPSAVKTVIHTGIDYHDLDRMHILLEQLDTLQQQLGKTKDSHELKQLTDKKQQLARIMVEIRSHHPEGANAKLNVKDRIHEGVTIYLGNAVEEFTREESGPLSLIENSLAGGLRRLSLTSLEINATELESSCRIQDEEARLARLEQERLEQERLEQERLEQEAAAAQAGDEAQTEPDTTESAAPHSDAPATT